MLCSTNDLIPSLRGFLPSYDYFGNGEAELQRRSEGAVKSPYSLPGIARCTVPHTLHTLSDVVFTSRLSVCLSVSLHPTTEVSRDSCD